MSNLAMYIVKAYSRTEPHKVVRESEPLNTQGEASELARVLRLQNPVYVYKVEVL